jgi:hypothetical protein
MVYADSGTMISNDVCSTMVISQSDSDDDDSDSVDPMATMAVKTLRLGISPPGIQMSIHEEFLA